MYTNLASRLGLEAIDRQKRNAPYIRDLVNAVKVFRTKGVYTNVSIRKSGLEAIIKRHTGLKVVLYMMEEDNASVTIPEISSANPIRDETLIGLIGHRDSNVFLRTKKFMFSQIDLKAGKVSGDLSKVVSHITLGKPMFRRKGWTERNIIAILLHEIGHLLTQHEAMFRYVRTNFIMHDAVERLSGVRETELRQVLVKKIEKDHAITLDGREYLIDNPATDEQVQVSVLATGIVEMRSELGYNLYHSRDCEAAADHYVARWGLEFDHIQALNEWEGKHTATKGEHIISSLINLTLALVTFPFLPFYLWVAADDQDIYDKPERRMRAVRNELVGRLGEAESPQLKAAIVVELDAVDKMLELVVDREGIIEYIGRNFIPGVRGNWRKVRTQMLMEELLNSEANIAAARFSRLAGA